MWDLRCVCRHHRMKLVQDFWTCRTKCGMAARLGRYSSRLDCECVYHGDWPHWYQCGQSLWYSSLPEMSLWYSISRVARAETFKHAYSVPTQSSHTHTLAHTVVHTSTHTHIHTHTHTHTHTHSHCHAHTTLVHAYTLKCMHINTHTNTQTHITTNSLQATVLPHRIELTRG